MQPDSASRLGLQTRPQAVLQSDDSAVVIPNLGCCDLLTQARVRASLTWDLHVSACQLYSWPQPWCIESFVTLERNEASVAGFDAF